MIYLFVFLAFILTWFFIEITLFFVNKNFINNNNTKTIPYNRFILNLRILAILLFLLAIIYMYFFQTRKFLEAIEYCLGIIK